MNVIIAKTEQERKDAYFVRTKVFIDEQHVPAREEIDQYEQDATHFVLYDDMHYPIGAGRFRMLDGIGKVERICVISSSRQKGAGVLIMKAIEEFAISTDIKKLKLNAQTHAIPFYESLGYLTVSDEFLDAGIPHKMMIKEI
ncbi:GNAT family N-acetyltransferase [Bacillus sp. CECT 9360]|uniref:GNAT family N-acetyltransferase n=1 Tax=Bacillus sp. CECT 9360 TaxID=2845821 RepID=UPI001E35A4D2|nr:GNAT family N-acetyltransferase [Bacillus sp. CECT 9360]CAH0344516.1 putative N-acetyltransferase YjcF [Bacillus sp. CECT 9360]